MLKANVDDGFHRALRQFADAATRARVPWMMVGATARVFLLEKVYGWPGGIATEDTDFAVLVENWDHYDRLCGRLVSEGGMTATHDPPKRLTAFGGLLVDLLPYGGVEEDGRRVFWPPDRDSLMTVRGFPGAMKAALTVRVNDDLDVRVASPAGLCALKLFAWEERHTQHIGRDAKDIAYLLRNAERLYPAEILHERFAKTVEASDYDIELAAISVFAADVGGLLETDEQVFVKGFIGEQVVAEEDGVLVRELHRYLKPLDASRVTKMLAAFLRGLEGT